MSENTAAPFRVLLTGSRSWPDPTVIVAALGTLHAEHGDRLVVVHGACRSGADMIADKWCRRSGVAVERFPADWKHAGRRAGLIRNEAMVATRPDLCLAFIHQSSPGATHCARMAQSAGVPTVVHTSGDRQPTIPTANSVVDKNTVKPALTPKGGKRAKQVVENTEYASFARRVLRGYARRVAAGDIEALRSLVLLPSDVDTTTRVAVEGLRAFGYSWAEIADRLGVTKQAAQMRYGNPTERGTLDRRITDAGIAVTVATLVAVFADHHPGTPAADTCPGCGYRYPKGVTDCPTNAAVRPVLYRRRGEDKHALTRLSDDQFADLHSRRLARANRTAARAAARPDPPSTHDTLTLFPLLPGTGGA